MKKIIKRTINRPPAGTYPGVIVDWDIVAEPATGASENDGVLVLKFKIQINKHLITTEKEIPLLWDTGDPMYNLCSQFDVLPEIGENFDCACFVGRTAEVIIEEQEQEGRFYSGVASLRPIQSTLPLELTNQLEEQGEHRNAVPRMVNASVEDRGNEAKTASPTIQKNTLQTGNVQPNRPVRKKKIGDVRQKAPLYGNL